MEYSIGQLRERARLGHKILDYEFLANVRDNDGNIVYSGSADVIEILSHFTHEREWDYTVDMKVVGLSEFGRICFLTSIDELLEEDRDAKILEEVLLRNSTLTVYDKPHKDSRRIAKAPFWIVDRVNEKLGDVIERSTASYGEYFIGDAVLPNVESACKEMGYNFRFVGVGQNNA